MTGMDDGPQGDHTLPADVTADPVELQHANGGRCPQCEPAGGCPAWRAAQLGTATTVIRRHRNGERCGRCRADGCPAVDGARAVVRAACRDLLAASGRRVHPLLTW